MIAPSRRISPKRTKEAEAKGRGTRGRMCQLAGLQQSSAFVRRKIEGAQGHARQLAGPQQSLAFARRKTEGAQGHAHQLMGPQEGPTLARRKIIQSGVACNCAFVLAEQSWGRVDWTSKYDSDCMHEPRPASCKNLRTGARKNDRSTFRPETMAAHGWLQQRRLPPALLSLQNAERPPFAHRLLSE